MKRNTSFLILVLLTGYSCFSQSVGIGTLSPDITSKLDIVSNSQGVLLPRMTTVQRKAIPSPTTGLLVFDLDKGTLYLFDGGLWRPLIFKNENQLDPIVREPADGAANALFGGSVDIDGDYAVIGATLDDIGTNINQGSVYVFFRGTAGWVQQAKLTAADGAANDAFGYNVAIDGNYVVVGVYGDDIGANTDQGSAYVFLRSGTTWTQQAKLVASDGASGDFFGGAVAIDFTRAVIGAYKDDIGANTDQGSAYVFTRSGATWTQEAKILSNDGVTNDHFGYSVTAGLNGDLVLVGAPNRLINYQGQGAVYMFGHSGTTWFQQLRIFVGEGQLGDGLGSSICFDDNYLVAGAPFRTEGANAYQGAAYIWQYTGGFTYQTKLLNPDGAGGDKFGYAVSINNNYILVGAHEKNENGNTWQGASYLFKRNGTTWPLARKIDDGDGEANGFFGQAVSISGLNLIIGAYGKNNTKGQVSFLSME